MRALIDKETAGAGLLKKGVMMQVKMAGQSKNAVSYTHLISELSKAALLISRVKQAALPEQARVNSSVTCSLYFGEPSPLSMRSCTVTESGTVPSLKSREISVPNLT